MTIESRFMDVYNKLIDIGKDRFQKYMEGTLSDSDPQILIAENSENQGYLTISGDGSFGIKKWGTRHHLNLREDRLGSVIQLYSQFKYKDSPPEVKDNLLLVELVELMESALERY